MKGLMKITIRSSFCTELTWFDCGVKVDGEMAVSKENFATFVFGKVGNHSVLSRPQVERQ